MTEAPGFNAWHADVASSAACNLIFQQALGLPPEVVSNSLLPWAGIAEVTAALRLAPGRILVDLACGRGGYGREVARRTGARLVARDLSAAGFEQIEVTAKPDWHARERRLWETVVQADADGDPALVSLQREGTRALATSDVKRRVFATAAAPTAGLRRSRAGESPIAPAGCRGTPRSPQESAAPHSPG